MPTCLLILLVGWMTEGWSTGWMNTEQSLGWIDGNLNHCHWIVYLMARWSLDWTVDLNDVWLL